jgi:N-formylglutamate amidohydrolase
VPAAALALLIHVPHASKLIPAEERNALLPDDASLSRELLRMTDAWTDRLVESLRLPATRLVVPVSRLVVDVERLADDAHEPMAAKGMGAVYTRLSTGEALRCPDPVERARLMAKWYYPHHAKLTRLVDDALAAEGRCLIVDVHSFPSRPLPHEADQDPERPEICIGTDPHHSPFWDDEDALATCAQHGFHALLNRPYAGSIVPVKHWKSTSQVRSFMVEVRRDLYMSETRARRCPRSTALRPEFAG